MVLLVQLSCRVRALQDPLEVPDVLAGLLDDLGAVVATSALVSGNDSLWAKRLDRVEGGHPLAPSFGTGLDEIEVDVVVGGVSGNDQADPGTWRRLVASVSVCPTSTQPAYGPQERVCRWEAARRGRGHQGSGRERAGSRRRRSWLAIGTGGANTYIPGERGGLGCHLTRLLLALAFECVRLIVGGLLPSRGSSSAAAA